MKDKKQRHSQKIDYSSNSKSPAGLARTKKIIRTEIAKEALFLEMCKNIKIDDFKQLRADKQRNDRRVKRVRNDN